MKILIILYITLLCTVSVTVEYRWEYSNDLWTPKLMSNAKNHWKNYVLCYV